MDPKKLNQIAKTALDALNGLEEPYRSITFKVILEKMLNEEEPERPSQFESNKKPVTSQKNIETKEHTLEEIYSLINRTDYPEIDKLTTAKDRALFILMIIRNDFNNDGLTSVQISDILDKVFRLKVTKYAINMALGPEVKLLDRKSIKTKGGEGFIYRIMAPGEQYINKKIGNVGEE